MHLTMCVWQCLEKKGELTAVLKSMKDVKPEDRPAVGQLVNETRSAIEEKLAEAKRAHGRGRVRSPSQIQSHRDPSVKEGKDRKVIDVTLQRRQRSDIYIQTPMYCRK